MTSQPILVSRHGIVLQYAKGNDLYLDGQASYVDDILDCMDSWDGRGSLKAYTQSMLQRELDLFDEMASNQTDSPDMLKGARTTLEETIALIANEPEEGLIKARIAYFQNPRKTIAIMLGAARGTPKQVIVMNPKPR